MPRHAHWVGGMMLIVVVGITAWVAVLLLAVAMGKRAAKPWPGDVKFAPKPLPPVVGSVVDVRRVDATHKLVIIQTADGTRKAIKVYAPDDAIKPGQWAAIRKVEPK